jgi:hypothetical protein
VVRGASGDEWGNSLGGKVTISLLDCSAENAPNTDLYLLSIYVRGPELLRPATCAGNHGRRSLHTKEAFGQHLSPHQVEGNVAFTQIMTTCPVSCRVTVSLIQVKNRGHTVLMSRFIFTCICLSRRLFRTNLEISRSAPYHTWRHTGVIVRYWYVYRVSRDAFRSFSKRYPSYALRKHICGSAGCGRVGKKWTKAIRRGACYYSIAGCGRGRETMNNN